MRLHDYMNDEGWWSRKLWFSVFAMLLIAGIGIAIIKYPTIQSIYSELVMGMIGVLSIYAGGNAVNKWTASRHSETFVRARQINGEEESVNDEDLEVGRLP